MLVIKNLHVSVDDKPILKGLNLHLPPGKVHAIMGPNGSGKSTLANVLAGKPSYTITDGEIILKGVKINELKPEERARAGLFLASQYPVEIPGVNNLYFMRTAYNELRKHRQEAPLDTIDFMALAKQKAHTVGLSESFLNRAVNEGFSGGEKKRNEILQMLLLEPSMAVMDETDSGLDVDALRLIGTAVNTLRHADRSFLIITHYPRLLDYIEPDVVHVMVQGRFQQSGSKALAHQLEKEGYGEFLTV